jgi:LysM repeat protein
MMVMYSYRSILVIWLALITQVFLHGCVQTSNYAPVVESKPVSEKENLRVIPENKVNVHDKISVPSEVKAPLPVQKPQTHSRDKYYVVKNGDTLYSIGILTGYGFERLAQWNRIQPPFQVNTGRRLKLFETDGGNITPYLLDKGVVRVENKKDLNHAAVQMATPKKLEDRQESLIRKPIPALTNTAFKQEKKSIISTDNKKMLKLNF